MIATWSQPWLVVLLLALAVGMLEAERWLTRWSRRRGQRVTVVAYVLDGLAVTSLLLSLLSLLALLVSGIIGFVTLLGEVLGAAGGALMASTWGLAVLAAVVIVLGLGTLVIRSRRRTPQGESTSARRVSAKGRRSSFFDKLAAEEARQDLPTSQTSSAVVSQQPAPLATQPAAAQIASPIAANPTSTLSASGAAASEGLASLSMMEQRRVRKAAPVPQSFLAPAPAVKERRGNVPLVLLLVLMIGGGAYYFRQQLFEILPGVWVTTSAAVLQTAEIVESPTTLVASPIPTPAASPKPAPTAALLSKQVGSDELNLRSGPGTDQEVIVTLHRGEQVVLLGETRDVGGKTWVHVRAGQIEGWVSQEFLE
jgi:hypothetical protein